MDLNDVFDFLKTIVELNRAYYVDKNKYIRHTTDTDDGNAEPVCVEQPGGKRVPIMLFHANMLSGDTQVLNPFSETFGESGERKWLLTYLCTLPGTLVQMTLLKIVEMALQKETDNNSAEQNDILSEYISKIDDKTGKELLQLRAIHYAFIIYNRRKRTAQLQVLDINRDEFKIRKKTWELIDGYIGDMLQISTDSTDDVVKQYTYTSNIIGCQEFDSTMHVVVKVCHSLRLYVKEFLGYTLPIEKLEMYLDAMEQFQKLTGWYAANVSRLPDPVKPATTSPWAAQNTNIPVPPAAPQQVVQQPAQQPIKIGGIPVPPGAIPVYPQNVQVAGGMFGGRPMYAPQPQVIVQQASPFGGNGSMLGGGTMRGGGMISTL